MPEPRLRRVVIESPYRASTAALLTEHVAYARKCLLDSFGRGESPYASHLLYTQPGVLNDDSPDERKLGIWAGFAWGETADLIAIYIDLGITEGMQAEISHYSDLGISLDYRQL